MLTVTPKEDPSFRINPGRGWMLMMPGAGPEKFRDWPWVSMVYHRVDWATLEPEEGKFAWDAPSWEGGFRRWTDAGFPVGLDVMCCNPHGPAYSTPKWVADAGCRGAFYRRDTGDPAHHGAVMDRWEPDYNDPIFQSKLEHFLTAMAARYDADPMVEFVTLRSYSAWGEWWTADTTQGTAETLNGMVDLHRRLFRQTPLLIPVASPAIWPTVIRPALEKGLGLRKDGLGGPIHPGEPELFDRAYHRAPVILEFWGPRDYLMARGWDKLFDKEECIRRWHASRVNMGFVGQARQWVEHEPGFLDRIARDAGYRFRIREASFDEKVRPGATLHFSAWWRNDGIAPYTRRGALMVILRDRNGREIVLHKDPAFPNAIPPVGHYLSEYTLPLPADLATGRYDLMVAMEDDFKGRITPIHLAHPDDARGRVMMGAVEVR